jgi:carboxypeptidase family protein/SdrD B-like protein
VATRDLLAVAVIGLLGIADLCLAQSTHGPTEPQPMPQGWQPFTIAKPTQKKNAAELMRLDDLRRARTQLPPQHDSVRTTLGVGHVLQRDWGLDLDSSGRISGFQTVVNAFVTAGPAGFEAPSARLSFVHDREWGGELGDLISELHGLTRGVRFGRTNGGWRPSLTMYLPNRRLHDTSTRIGYRDEVRLFSHIVAGGEVTSDGSHFVRTGLVARRFDILGSYRRVMTDDIAKDVGALASYTLPGAIVASAGVQKFENAADRGASRLFALRFPIAGLVALTLEDNRSLTQRADDAYNAVGLQLLRGPVQLTQRYQWGASEYIRPGDPAIAIEQRLLQTSGSFSPAPRLSFSPQLVVQWLPDGRAQQWQELQSEVRLSRGTRIQIYTSIPDVANPNRFRSRYIQDLPHAFALVTDYGRVSPFQGNVYQQADGPAMSIMLRKTWRTPTPTYGGTVAGRVVDHRGRPVAGAGVRLGPYLTFADSNGRYRFPKVPAGQYDLRIDRESLPAQYAAEGIAHHVVTSGAATTTVDLTVTPLDSIRGRVYVDTNDNGQYDAGEGRPGIVIHLEEQVTETDQNGVYGFYNLAPGKYLVELDEKRLPEPFATRDARVNLTLSPDQSATGVDFLLVEKQKPVVLKRLYP